MNNYIEKIKNMSNAQLEAIWHTFDKITWNCSTMFDKNITMDEWGVMIAAEMDSRGIQGSV